MNTKTDTSSIEFHIEKQTDTANVYPHLSSIHEFFVNNRQYKINRSTNNLVVNKFEGKLQNTLIINCMYEKAGEHHAQQTINSKIKQEVGKKV